MLGLKFVYTLQSHGRPESTKDVCWCRGIKLGPIRVAIASVEREKKRGQVFQICFFTSTLLLVSRVGSKLLIALTPCGETEDGWRYVRSYTPFSYLKLDRAGVTLIFGLSRLVAAALGGVWRLRFGTDARLLGSMAHRHF